MNEGNRLVYKGAWSFEVRKDFVLNPAYSIGAKMLYIAIRSYCDNGGDTAFPSSKTLSAALGVSRDKIFKCAKELEAAGLLEREQSHCPKSDKNEKETGQPKPGGFSHTVYTLYATESPKQPIESRGSSVDGKHRYGKTPSRQNTVAVKNGTNSIVPIISKNIGGFELTSSALDTEPEPVPQWSPTPLQLRLNGLFNRRSGTRWDKNEIKSLKLIGEVAEEDLKVLEAYYSASIPDDVNYRRRSLGTLLNNFAGEVDRARNFTPPKERRCF